MGFTLLRRRLKKREEEEEEGEMEEKEEIKNKRTLFTKAEHMHTL